MQKRNGERENKVFGVLQSLVGLRKVFGLGDVDIQELEQHKYRVALVTLCLSVYQGSPVSGALLPVWSSHEYHSGAS